MIKKTESGALNGLLAMSIEGTLGMIKGMEKEYNIRLMELLKKKDNGKIINLLNDLSAIINL